MYRVICIGFGQVGLYKVYIYMCVCVYMHIDIQGIYRGHIGDI